jgi:hypothetical protein
VRHGRHERQERHWPHGPHGRHEQHALPMACNTMIMSAITSNQASNWSQQRAGAGAGARKIMKRTSCTTCVAGGCGYARVPSHAIGRGRKQRMVRWWSGCGYAGLTSDLIARGRKQRKVRWCSGCGYAGLTSDAIGRGRKQRKERWCSGCGYAGLTSDGGCVTQVRGARHAGARPMAPSRERAATG